MRFRPYGNIPYRINFIISAEGAVTEPKYFDLFKNTHVNVLCLDLDHKSAPQYVLKRMKKYLKGNRLGKSDQAWLVVDKDQWNDDELAALHDWAQQDAHYGFALSNPCCEYWLLLHFEKGDGIKNKDDCIRRLKKHLPDYQKDISTTRFTASTIRDAIERAQKRDNPPCTDWPRRPGGATVYKLVEQLLAASQPA